MSFPRQDMGRPEEELDAQHVFRVGGGEGSYSCAECRQGFAYVLEADYQLIEVLKGIGPERAVDMDDAAQRTSLEVGAPRGLQGPFIPALLQTSITYAGGLLSALFCHNSLPHLIKGCSNRTPVCSRHVRAEMQQSSALRILLECTDFSASLDLTARPDAGVAALQLPACMFTGHWESRLWQDLWLPKVSGPSC